MGHDRLKDSQDMSEDNGVLPSSAEQESVENRPGSSLSVGKKKKRNRILGRINILVQLGWEHRLEEVGGGSQL